MGWAATRKLRTVLDNLTSLLAVELLAAVRGLQLRAPLTPSPAGRAAVAAVAAFAGEPGPDIFLAPVLEAARARSADPRPSRTDDRVPARPAWPVRRRGHAAGQRWGEESSLAMTLARARKALPRWLIASFSAGVSSALVRFWPSPRKIGS